MEEPFKTYKVRILKNFTHREIFRAGEIKELKITEPEARMLLKGKFIEAHTEPPPDPPGDSEAGKGQGQGGE